MSLPGERLGLWGDFVCRHIGPLRPTPLAIRCSAAVSSLARPATSRWRASLQSASRAAHAGPASARTTATPSSWWRRSRGAGCFEQNGRKVVLAPGEWSLYDTTRPYAVSNPERIEQVIMLLPRDELVRLGLDLDDLVVRRFTGRAGIGRLTYDMLVSAFESLRADMPVARRRRSRTRRSRATWSWRCSIATVCPAMRPCAR